MNDIVSIRKIRAFVAESAQSRADEPTGGLFTTSGTRAGGEAEFESFFRGGNSLSVAAPRGSPGSRRNEGSRLQRNVSGGMRAMLAIQKSSRNEASESQKSIRKSACTTFFPLARELF